MRKRTALTSMTVGMFIMPVSALCMASGNMLDTNSLILDASRSLHDGGGYRLPRLAETFISPRFLEYFSLQAPKGEEGLYLGFSICILSSPLSSDSAIRFPFKQVLPGANPVRLSRGMAGGKRERHYIWYYFGAIALVSAVALIVYGQVVKRLDSQKIDPVKTTRSNPLPLI